MACNDSNTNPCTTCNQGIDIPICTTLCDFEISGDCVTIDAMSCLGIEEGDKLNQAISALNTYLTTLNWTDIEGGREGIETLEYAITCQNEVKLKGTIELDDYLSGFETPIVFPGPPQTLRFSLNFLDTFDGTTVVGVGIFEVLTDGTSKFYFNQADILNNPPSIALDFTGLSYFLTN